MKPPVEYKIAIPKHVELIAAMRAAGLLHHHLPRPIVIVRQPKEIQHGIRE